MTVDSSRLLVEGPWRHELVAANGSRFHVALSGPDEHETPLVVLLHGFPQMWWAWRHQIPALAGAGYRVAAMDLRGTGASDKPPIGYDVPMLARDVAGVVRSLGARRAVVVGHGTGGEIAWATAATQPTAVRAVAALAAPHPYLVRTRPTRVLTSHTARHLAFIQLPSFPERAFVRRGRARKVLTEWAGRGVHDEAALELYDAAMQVPFAAHSTMERQRWQVRSVPRFDGRRYTSALRETLTVPALQVHGRTDAVVPVQRARPEGPAVAAAGDRYRFAVVEAGHFLHEENPAAVNETLLGWLGEVAPA